MQGAFYDSFEDVRLGKAQTDAEVQQTSQTYIAALQAATSLPSAEPALNTSWLAFYAAWTGFMTTGTDQTSTLWFPNLPDESEYQQLQSYQAQLATLQKQMAAAYPSAGIVTNTATAPTWSWLGFYPLLSPAANATLTSATYVLGAVLVFDLFGPLIRGTSEIAGGALEEGASTGPWSPSPRKRTRR
jgi:hypothetical protein